LTAATQTFAIGTSGISPAFSSSTSTHTLNIPMASTTSVTAGLLSKADYDLFNSKQAALTAGSGISIGSGTISATGLTTSNLAANAGITNAQLANSSINFGATSISLGGTITTVAGLSNITATNFIGTLSGTANAASKLSIARNINGIAFDGTADITLAASAGTLTGTTLATNVVNSTLAGVGTITSGNWNGSVIPVLYGGTGVTTSTGAGSVVLNNSPTLSSPSFTNTTTANILKLTGDFNTMGTNVPYDNTPYIDNSGFVIHSYTELGVGSTVSLVATGKNSETLNRIWSF